MMTTNHKKTIRSLVLNLLSALCYLGGIIGLAASPWYFVHKTYLSENALMPGSATTQYGQQQFNYACNVSHRWAEFKAKTEDDNPDADADWILNEFSSFELEALKLPYNYVDLAIDNNVNEMNRTKKGWNVYSVVRAPKGSGTEAIVIATRYNKKGDLLATGTETSGLGLGLSLMKHFITQKWNAKDIIFVASDDSRGGRQGIQHWLTSYLQNDFQSGLIRSGIIQAAINIDINATSPFSQLSIAIEGANGQLPNLDLVNTVVRVSRRDGMRDEAIVLSELPPFLQNLINTSQGKPLLQRIPSQLYTLLTFMINQAIGIPTGDHGVFNTYHIDAITLSNKFLEGHQNMTMLSMGRILDRTVRSLNNLIERLHQSFYYYLLPTHNTYISIGEYMIPLGLLLFGFVIKILIVVISAKYDSGITHSLLLAGVYQIAGVIVLLMPSIIQNVALKIGVHLSITQVIVAWMIDSFIVLSALHLIVVRAINRRFNELHRESLKAFACISTLLFIGVGSLLNFSFCFLAAAFLIPLYSAMSFTHNRFGQKLQLLLLLIHSPVVFILGLSLMFHTNPVELLALLYEQYQQYSNLTFPFLCLSYLPINLAFFQYVKQ